MVSHERSRGISLGRLIAAAATGMLMLWTGRGGPGSAQGASFVFEKATDDVWQYPFNSMVGTRDTAPVFSSVGNGFYTGFNDRDGIILMAWETAEKITAGRPPGAYDVRAVTVTLTHQDCPPGDCGVFVEPASWLVDLTVDEWFSYDANNNGVRDGLEVPDSDPGRPLELFGVEFGPTYAPETWTEEFPLLVSTCVFGQNVCNFRPRDPFPFTFQPETGAVLHVEDSVKGRWNEGLSVPLCSNPTGVCPFTPVPWATGRPMGYTPGTQTAPFDVEFSVNLELVEGRVRQRIQEELSTGRVAFALTSLLETDVQAGGNPTFFLREATEPRNGQPPIPGAKAPRLNIVLRLAATGDPDDSHFVDWFDHESLVDCLGGPGQPPPATPDACLDSFDFDRDDDVDLVDAAEFVRRFHQGT